MSFIELGMGWKMGKNCTQSVEYDPRVVSVIKVKGTVSSHIEKHDCKTVRKKMCYFILVPVSKDLSTLHGGNLCYYNEPQVMIYKH